MAVFSAIAFAIGATIGFAINAAATALATWAVAKAVSFVFGGAKSNKMDTSDPFANSPNYGVVKQEYANPSAPRPLIYGEVKMVGNRIYQTETNKPIIKLLAFGDGEIESFSDIRLNDIPYTDVAGCVIRSYLGTSSQTVDNFVEGVTLLNKIEKVGSLKYLAYLAVSVPESDKINQNYNLTAIVKGRKVRVYTNATTYTTVYSNNPVWCLLDAMTSYNGAGLGLDSNGAMSDEIMTAVFDIDSFISAANYCDELITYYQLITALTGDNNDLIFRTRKANDNTVSITYSSGASMAISVVGKDITITRTALTTANDVISLINNNAEALKLVQVFKADNNSGAGLITDMPKTFINTGVGSKRYTFNMVFDSQIASRDAIEQFKLNCKGLLTEKNKKLQFKIDRLEDISAIFGTDAIMPNSEEFNCLPSDKQYDICNVNYIDKSHEWSKVSTRTELSTFKHDVPVEHTIDVNSCTDFQHSSRLAWFYLNRQTIAPYSGKFITDFRAVEREVGDVIALTTTVMNYTNYPVKITNITPEDGGLYTVNWQDYKAELYTDELGSIEPTVNVTNLNDILAFPSDILSFNVVQNRTLLEFNWLKNNDIDTYEIRQGSSWETSSLVSTGLTGENYTMPLQTKGLLTYWIKAKNKYNYSEIAKSDLINILEIPTLNEVINISILGDSGYTATDCYIYKSELKLNYTDLWEDKTPLLWDNPSSYFSTRGKWGSAVKSSGVFVSKVYDIGTISTSVFSANADVFTFDTGNYNIEISTSNDNITYSDYVILNNASLTCRYFKIRVTLISSNLTQVILSNLTITVDIPDRVELYTNRAITDANAGITITYATDTESKNKQPFILSVPHILATPYNTNAYYEVSSSTSTQCVVKLRTNAGVLTTGNVNIQVRGY